MFGGRPLAVFNCACAVSAGDPASGDAAASAPPARRTSRRLIAVPPFAMSSLWLMLIAGSHGQANPVSGRRASGSPPRHASVPGAARDVVHPLQRLVEREGARLLARREFLERLEEWNDNHGCRQR